LNMKLLISVCLLALVCPSLATLGLDVSAGICQSMSQSTWNCLAGTYGFAVIQTFEGGFGFNSAIGTCVSEAHAAGIQYVDVYIFMCPNCKGNTPASSAVTGIINSLNGVAFGMVWFDIEQCEGCWNDAESNADFIGEAVNTAVSMLGGSRIGIYSNAYEWGQVVGGWEGVSSFPLWYADYDGEQNYNDFSPFGGWTQPNIKQYAGDEGECGVDIDENWY